MRTLACDDNNDLYIGGDGMLAMRTGKAATEQCARTAVQAQRGEMIYAMDRGMPTRETAFDDLNPPQFEAAARDIITDIPGVTGIESFVMEQVGDRFKYTANIETIYGAGSVSNG